MFHIDFDYFYAQCEEIRNPKIKSCPVCVCVYSDRNTDSGAIATANYIARRYKIKSGASISFAKKQLEKINNAVFLPVDFDYYSEISEKAMEIIKDNSDVFEYVGRDEAYMDVTKKIDCDFKRAAHLAQQIKNSLRQKIKLGCSVGISSNKLISKIASDFKKPDGLTLVLPETSQVFLEGLEIRTIPGIGKKTEDKLAQMNLKSIKDLKKLDVFTLNKEFGRKNGTYIYNAARGINYEPVHEKDARIQYSKITTLKKDSKDYEFLAENLIELCNKIHEIIMTNNQMFKSVGIHLIQTDLSNKSKSRMLKNSTTNLKELQKNTLELLSQALETQSIPIRRLGVRVSELSDMQGQSSITNYF